MKIKKVKIDRLRGEIVEPHAQHGIVCGENLNAPQASKGR